MRKRRPNRDPGISINYQRLHPQVSGCTIEVEWQLAMSSKSSIEAEPPLSTIPLPVTHPDTSLTEDGHEMLEPDQIYQANAFDLFPRIEDGSIDLIVCDGPYGVTINEWDRIDDIQEFNLELIRIFSKKLREGGGLYLFGKPDCIDFIDYRPFLNLKSKIVWYQPSRLAQGRFKYTNNYDIICYFIKGEKAKTFDLDAIRVPQLVELDHRLRCERVPSVVSGKYGKTKFNGNGKNPGDVWGDIKQLTYRSKELVNREAPEHDPKARTTHRASGQSQFRKRRFGAGSVYGCRHLPCGLQTA